jgi:aminoglycoside 3-N-acetyltransferase
MLEKLSALALRRLDGDQIARLRQRYLVLRSKMKPVLERLHGTFDANDLHAHLITRVGVDFEILMVHSSTNKLAPMYRQGPLELLAMLKDFCGPSRTLVMPAFYFGDPRLSGVSETFAKCPRFDVRRVPSQMGLLTELFRRSQGVLVSRHPVYRVAALGPLAEELVRGHEFATTPAGRGTPFDVMARYNAQIVGIGKPFEVLTQVHHAEDVLGDRFPVPWQAGMTIPMTLVDGAEEIPYTFGGRGFLWRRNMWKLRDIMRKEDLLQWKFHNVPLFATRAGRVSESLIAAAKAGVTLYEKP